MTRGCSKHAALIAVAVAVWPAAMAHAQTAAGLEGTYCLRGVHEVGSCLRLAADGKFEYFLAYGAYDERSEGDWKTDGADVVLDSPPYDKAPAFTFKGLNGPRASGSTLPSSTRRATRSTASTSARPATGAQSRWA